MFDFGNNVDHDKLSNSTLLPVYTNERESRNDVTRINIVVWLLFVKVEWAVDCRLSTKEHKNTEKSAMKPLKFKNIAYINCSKASTKKM